MKNLEFFYLSTHVQTQQHLLQKQIILFLTYIFCFCISWRLFTSFKIRYLHDDHSVECSGVYIFISSASLPETLRLRYAPFLLGFPHLARLGLLADYHSIYRVSAPEKIEKCTSTLWRVPSTGHEFQKLLTKLQATDTQLQLNRSECPCSCAISAIHSCHAFLKLGHLCVPIVVSRPLHSHIFLMRAKRTRSSRWLSKGDSTFFTPLYDPRRRGSRMLNSRRNALCHAVMDPLPNDKLSPTHASALRSVTAAEPTHVVCRALVEKPVKHFIAPPNASVNTIIVYLMLA
jgi:hypothetical protein